MSIGITADVHGAHDAIVYIALSLLSVLGDKPCLTLAPTHFVTFMLCSCPMRKRRNLARIEYDGNVL